MDKIEDLRICTNCKHWDTYPCHPCFICDVDRLQFTRKDPSPEGDKMSIISDPELDAFDENEMEWHRKEGFCGVKDCHYCADLEYEIRYWEDWEDMEAGRMEDWLEHV